MYVDVRDHLLGNWTEITVSVWEQRQYDAPLGSRQASQGCKWQPSLAAHSIWEALYINLAMHITVYRLLLRINYNQSIQYYEINRFVIFKMRLEHQCFSRNFENAIICVFWLWMLDIKYIIWAIWCYLQIKYFLVAFFFYRKWLIFIYRCNQKFHVFKPLWPRFLHCFSVNLFITFQGP